MVKIAVTGSIACGKSRVATCLQERGVPVCEADIVAHQALAPDGAAYPEVVEAFGAGILTETSAIDRLKLGRVVFSDPLKMAILNRVLHPVVKIGIEQWLEEQARDETPMVAVVVPLLFEADMEQGWDAVICVGCSPEVQMDRLRSRGYDATDSERRVLAQMALSEKVKRSDYVIWNDGSVSALEKNVDEVLGAIEESRR